MEEIIRTLNTQMEIPRDGLQPGPVEGGGFHLLQIVLGGNLVFNFFSIFFK